MLIESFVPVPPQVKSFLKLTLCDSYTHKILIPKPDRATPAAKIQIKAVLGNWRNSKATIKERNISLFNNDLLTDVSFVIGALSHRLDVSSSTGPRGGCYPLAPPPHPSTPASYSSVLGFFFSRAQRKKVLMIEKSR